VTPEHRLEVIFGDKREEVDIALTSGEETLVGFGLLAYRMGRA
jgi:hypothetical protein